MASIGQSFAANNLICAAIGVSSAFEIGDGVKETERLPALLSYDTLLTFSREIDCIWRRKFSAVTLLYAIARYGTLGELILETLFKNWVPGSVGVCITFEDLSPMGSSGHSCKAMFISASCLNVLHWLGFAAFSSLRVWVICDKKLAPFLAVLIPGLYCAFSNLYTYTQLTDIGVHHAPPSIGGGCTYKYRVNTSTLRILYTAAPAIVIIVDALALSFTWVKTARVRRHAREVGIQTSLISLLVRFGALYFGILLVLSTVVLLLNVVSSKFLYLASMLVYTTAAIDAIVTCRFFLDLRSVYLSDGPQTGDERSVHTLRFASRVTGNIGAPLEHSSIWTSGAVDYVDDESAAEEYLRDPLMAGLDSPDVELSDRNDTDEVVDVEEVPHEGLCP